MIICCYLLHQGGKEEYQKITDNLNINNINFDQEIFNNGNEILLYIRKTTRNSNRLKLIYQDQIF